MTYILSRVVPIVYGTFFWQKYCQYGNILVVVVQMAMTDCCWHLYKVLFVLNFTDVNSEEQVPGTKNNGHNENLQHTHRSHGGGPKTWTQEDMDMALDALRNHNMSLTKVK